MKQTTRTLTTLLLSVFVACTALAAGELFPRIYVGKNGLSEISVYDAETFELIGTARVGSSPVRVAVHPQGQWVYTANNKSGSISTVDAETLEEIDRLTTGGAPIDLQVSSDGAWLYVAHDSTGEVRVYSATPPIEREVTVSLRGGFSDLTLDETETNLYVTSNRAGRLYRIPLVDGLPVEDDIEFISDPAGDFVEMTLYSGPPSSVAPTPTPQTTATPTATPTITPTPRPPRPTQGPDRRAKRIPANDAQRTVNAPER